MTVIVNPSRAGTAGGGGGTSGTVINQSASALSRAGWTVTASRTGGGTSTANAIDSNTGTRWATGGAISVGSDYFEIDLGSAQTVSGMLINNATDINDHPSSGDVQYSDDNSSWTTAASWSISASVRYVSAAWSPASHRYWRVLAQGTAIGGAGNWWSIDEINLYGSAAFWGLAASGGKGDGLYAAIDGSTSTKWQTGHAISAGTDYYKVDFGTAATVGGFKQNNPTNTGDIPTAGDVQYSDDNSSWTTAVSWTSGDIASNALKKSWTPASHRYWRLLAQGTANGGGSNWWSIDELIWYSDAAP